MCSGSDDTLTLHRASFYGLLPDFPAQGDELWGIPSSKWIQIISL